MKTPRSPAAVGWKWPTSGPPAAWAVALSILVAAAPLARAQPGVVAGTVISDQSRLPVAGAQVAVAGRAGTTRGAVADAAGRFRLTELTGSEVRLEVRMLGFRPLVQTVRVGDTNVQLVLAVAAVSLDQVVVTGTAGGTQARALGNVVSQVKAADVMRAAPVTTVQQLLGARATGVVIMPGSGNVGTGSVTRIRGVSSLSLANDPLIYIDGVRANNNPGAGPNIRQGRQVSRLNDLSPEDIESLEIIKGPAAATLYGTEASNGVIQIITKRGSAGTPSFDVTVKHGGTWIMDVEGKVPTVYSRDATGKIVGVNLLERERAAGREIFQTGPLQSYALSLKGGTAQIRYYVSGESDNEEGVVDYNWQRKTSARANVGLLPGGNVDVNTNLGFVRTHTRFAQAAAGWGIWDQLVWGSPSQLTTPTRGFLRATPEAAGEIESFADIDRFNGSVQLNHTPWRWLKHRLTYGADVSDEGNSILFPRNPLGTAYFFGALSLGQKTVERNRSIFTTLDYSATGAAELPWGLSSETSAGVQRYRKYFEFVQAVGRQFPAPSVKSVGGAAITTSNEDIVENKTLGLYVQEQLAWNNRVFLTGAVRGDDNSAFGENFDAAIYPKFSASWVMNEEPWWGLRFVNAFKLRAAFGYAGQQPDVFAAIRLYQPATGPGDVSVLTPQTIGNPDLAPEKSREIELGFDAGLLDDRVGVNVTLYDQRRRDAIVQQRVPPSLGFPGFRFTNVGAVSNRGVEVGVDARLYQSPRLEWGLDLKLSANENEVEDLGGLPPIAVGTAQESREGFPVAAFFYKKVVSAQLDASGRPTNILCAGDASTGSQPLPCDQAPRVYFGTPTPKWEGAVSSNLTLWKDLRLYALVDFRGGHMIQNGDINAAHTTFRNSKAILEATDPILLAYDRLGLTDATGFLDAGFAKLREVSVTYDVPSRWTRQIRASRASVTLAGRNLATVWRAQKDVFGQPIPDPEVRTPAAELSGYVQTVLPPYSQWVTTVRIAF